MISIVVPTFNEAENLPTLVERIRAALKEEYELVIIDDDSPDGTGEIAEGLAKRYGNMRVIHRLGKGGLTSAVLEGLKIVEGNVVTVMDADLQHPPEVLPNLLREVEAGRDIAIASRYVGGGEVEAWSLWRRLTSKGAIWLAHLLFPKTRTVKDPVSGYFCIERGVLTGANINPVGCKILLEILVKGNYATVEEVPYTFESRKLGKSKLSLVSVYAYLKQLLILMKQTGELKRVAKFCLVGLSGVIVNEGMLWLLTERLGLFYMLSSLFAVESATINNFAWNEVWTFRGLRRQGVMNSIKRMLKFNLTRVIGALMNFTILFTLTELVGIYYLVANLVAIMVVTSWDYTTSMSLVWK